MCVCVRVCVCVYVYVCVRARGEEKGDIEERVGQELFINLQSTFPVALSGVQENQNEAHHPSYLI